MEFFSVALKLHRYPFNTCAIFGRPDITLITTSVPLDFYAVVFESRSLVWGVDYQIQHSPSEYCSCIHVDRPERLISTVYMKKHIKLLLQIFPVKRRCIIMLR